MSSKASPTTLPSPCSLHKKASFDDSSTDDSSISCNDELIQNSEERERPELYQNSNRPATTNPLSPNRNNNNLFHLMICAIGICTCYMSCGFVNERVYSMPSVKEAGPISSFVVMTQTFTNFVVALLWKCYTNEKTDRSGRSSRDGGVLNHKLFVVASFCYFAAMTLTNESLNYVSYPMATLAKSSKIIPNMIMGYLIEHKTYSNIEYIGTSFISIGIIAFNLSRLDSTNTNQSSDSSYGLLLLFLSLAADGVLSSFQNMIKKKTDTSKYRVPTAMETMLCMNFYAFLFLLPTSCIVTSHLQNGIHLLATTSSSDKSFLYLLLCLNGSAAIGQIFIFMTITKFSPLVCTIITTTRKFFTILFSVLYFGHVFSYTQWFCTMIVFSGIYLEIFYCDHIVVAESANQISSNEKKKDE